MTKTSDRRRMDDESMAMIFEGVTVSQTSRMFSMDVRDVKMKIANKAVPVGERSGSSTYLIKDIAPLLVKPKFTDDELDRLIARMTIADLPPMLRKELWAARRSQQAFEKEAAILVNADEVAAVIGDLFKTVRMSLLLTRDLVERETELTDRQRYIVTENVDRTLETLHAEIVKQFGQVKERAAKPVDEYEEEEEL